ncbi:hypothetical protein BH20ACI4_BH20ACI4_07980 [soil metagenome]
MSRRCSTEVKLLRRRLVEELANKAKQLSDEDYKKFMDYLRKLIAQDEQDEKKNKLNEMPKDKNNKNNK